MKSRAFKAHRYIGDPINAVKIFNDLKADELVFLDITASREKRLIPISFVEDVGAEANMPFSVGGGIRTISDIRAILSAGAEKVVINSHALKEPGFVREASKTFGSSTITVCIDVKKQILRGRRVWGHSGTKASRYTPVEYAKTMEDQGAGELIVQSIEKDGTMSGYDTELVSEVSRAVTIPVVALGGAGNLEHMSLVYENGFANAMAAGSIFVYHGPKHGVLINYPERREILERFGSQPSTAREVKRDDVGQN